ncbi:MAG: histidinol dehydrogenase, partial [Pseudomonadota bacterium]|nr:histidinol dehydrogenase [Pseudomonadota bacterium]
MGQLIARLDSSDPNFDAAFARLLVSPAESDSALAETVSSIIAAVAVEGDAALLRFTNQFDGRALSDPENFRVAPSSLLSALQAIDPAVRVALEHAAARIRDFHERQLGQSWQYRDDTGSVLGQRVSAMDRVGLYVPGGRASYPSSVLMNAIPAKVAGVSEVIMVVPAPSDEISPVVLAAAQLAGVDSVFTIGGAQAIGALAY